MQRSTTRTRRDIGFHLTLCTDDRELLDRLAALQGVSRTTLIARALHNLAAQVERHR